MSKIIINKKIKSFKSTILIPGDKSLSIRWVLFASLANGISKAKNLLKSEDVFAAINAIKKLGIRVTHHKNETKIYGKGINGYEYRKDIKINAQNSGTLGRLILGILIDTPYPVKILGDKSLSKRDFKRVTDPLSKFGAKFTLKKSHNLPLTINGSLKLNPIKYTENKGSAQCKSSVIFGAMKARGTTIIKAKKSRNHTELLCKYLGLPVLVKNKKTYDEIKIKQIKKIKKLNYNIPSDISSSAFFIGLTVLSPNSKLTIKNVNINPSRTGVITILRRMGVSIEFTNEKIYKGEKRANIIIKSAKKLKAINCPSKFNSSAIDEFLIIFLIAAKANGVSSFKNLNELNQKESPRLKWAQKILNKMGIKTIIKRNSIKIFGNPQLKIDKEIVIKNYLKDHRVFMTSVIAALSFGGKWIVHDKDSINSSFPNFLKVVTKLKNNE
ncbi:3-phosphoshikimate 1-carboxyvinyltransferase [Candidatus Pelagibacter sp.]|nr:3-phosphoshikimate 1-carboxyvinyltransferase [Candidatus Pelagibacter sp.]